MHVPSGYCYGIVDHESKLFKPPIVYSGDIIDHVLAELRKDAMVLHSIMRRIGPINMTNDVYTKSTTCHLCDGPLTNDDKLRNHCHRTGKYFGAAHTTCKLICK